MSFVMTFENVDAIVLALIFLNCSDRRAFNEFTSQQSCTLKNLLNFARQFSASVFRHRQIDNLPFNRLILTLVEPRRYKVEICGIPMLS